MLHCICRSVGTAQVKQAFNELDLTADQLHQDVHLLALYTKAVDIAREAGRTVSGKPLEKRCPPCKIGFRDFVIDAVAPEQKNIPA